MPLPPLACLRGLALGLVLLSSGSAAAEAPAALCERAVAHGARATGVPEAVLHAVALTETGRAEAGRLRPWPWAVNREGQEHWFDGPEAVLAFARRSLGEGRPSFDLGCFQINYHWHGARFASLEAMLDPMEGAVYAGRFLRELFGEFGSWQAAAGAYHSRTPEVAGRYRARFERILAGLGGGGIAVAEAAAPERPRSAGGIVRRVRGPLIITVPPGGAGVPQVTTGSRSAAVAAATSSDPL